MMNTLITLSYIYMVQRTLGSGATDISARDRGGDVLHVVLPQALICLELLTKGAVSESPVVLHEDEPVLEEIVADVRADSLAQDLYAGALASQRLSNEEGPARRGSRS